MINEVFNAQKVLVLYRAVKATFVLLPFLDPDLNLAYFPDGVEDNLRRTHRIVNDLRVAQYMRLYS